MPELPEVEASRKIIEKYCVGKRISRAVALDDEKVIQGVSHTELQQGLNGRVVVAAKRKGKNLWLELDRKPWPSIHLGMSGSIYIQGGDSIAYVRYQTKEDDIWPPKFSKLLIDFEDGVHFAFTDSRRFGRIRLLDDPKGVPPISELGPDAYSEFPSLEDFEQMLKKRKGEIKPTLLDQKFLSGIGNWVADEVLYQSYIHPKSLIPKFSSSETSSLHRSIQHVLQFSVDCDANYEFFPKEWLFHHRWNKKKGTVNGHSIDFITVGGRTSAYVPALQKLLKATASDPKVSLATIAKSNSNSTSNHDSDSAVVGSNVEADTEKNHPNFQSRDSLLPSLSSSHLPLSSPQNSAPLVSVTSTNKQKKVLPNIQPRTRNPKKRETSMFGGGEENSQTSKYVRRSERIAKLASISSNILSPGLTRIISTIPKW